MRNLRWGTGRINIVYECGKMDVIEVIFGVNAWPYELFTPIKSHETGLNTYGGPYPEPFGKDPKARELLKGSLVLTENDAEKGAKYIMAVQAQPEDIQCIQFVKDSSRDAAFLVSAVTGVLDIDAEKLRGFKLIDSEFFLKKRYYHPLDKLARRLYQFKDDIPSKVEGSRPDGYAGPQVRFYGNSAADIFTNLLYHNLHDMAAEKVDCDGMPHTSSRWAPNFGSYVGFGTFKEGVGSYHKHIWSRDVGRILTELVKAGESDRTLRSAELLLHDYLYDKSPRFGRPNWKRIANAGKLEDPNALKFASGKENDGHAAVMMFIYNLFRSQAVGEEWLIANKEHLVNAAEWFCWQMDSPEESSFDAVLYSESEASTQLYGGYDLFSNTYAYYALMAFTKLASAMKDEDLSMRWNGYASKLRWGILNRFTTDHPRHGRIFVDTIHDCWTWEYKRFAPLFLSADLLSYELESADPEFYEICKNTYQAQKEDYFSYAAGRQMGYGQGYITQASILLDEFDDIKGYTEQAALFCYHHTDYPYIVPEGVIMHPSGRFWFRNCDLGNAVQQGEIVKCARLLVGVDDLSPERGLLLVPRLPEGWSKVAVEGYPAGVISGRETCRVTVSLMYERQKDGYHLAFKSTRPLDLMTVRMGPFTGRVEQVTVEGVIIRYS